MGSSFQDLLKLVEQFVDSGKTKAELEEVARQVKTLRRKLVEDQDLADAVLRKLADLMDRM